MPTYCDYFKSLPKSQFNVFFERHQRKPLFYYPKSLKQTFVQKAMQCNKFQENFSVLRHSKQCDAVYHYDPNNRTFTSFHFASRFYVKYPNQVLKTCFDLS